MSSREYRLNELEKLISKLSSRIDFLNKKSNKFSSYRLIIFIFGIAASITGFMISNVLGWILLIIFLATFGIVVHFHNKLLFGIKKSFAYKKIKEEHLARMNLDWEKIPLPAIHTAPYDQTLEKDLDLTGSRSLQNLIDISVSYEGSSLLRNWLSIYSPDYETILRNQNIIKELSGLTRFRDKFLLKANLISKKILDCGKILNWTKNDLVVDLPKWLLPAASVLILIYMVLFILYTLDLSGFVWFFVFLIYFFLYSSYQKKISKITEQSIELENQIKKFTSLIFYFENFLFTNYPHLNTFFESFIIKNNALLKLKALQKNIYALMIRENPIVRLLVNIVFPYDIFFCNRLNRIKSEVEYLIPHWFEKLNELECYISLSNFTYLNPEYVFPEILLRSKNEFEIKSLGHPLIKSDKKVCNNFSLNKENEIVIITGSNMSGKSTFLKTLGVNLCLAYSGAPVDAKYLRTSLFELFTCIKVNDSVADGISYFYAEVKRLRELLDEFQNEKHLSTFFLIDEIFKGTNNKERLQGSRAFIKKLSQSNGTGAVSTHDLELVNLADEINSISNYHFREEIVNGKMKFDYKIHKGPCPTTNALKIMEMSGLPVK